MAAWIMLLCAGLLEIVWAVALKRTQGFTVLWPSVLTIAAMLGSFFLLARAMVSLPTGVAYAVWVGIGAIGVALVSATIMGERLSPAQLGFLALVAGGIVGLKLATPAHTGRGIVAPAVSTTKATPPGPDSRDEPTQRRWSHAHHVHPGRRGHDRGLRVGDHAAA